MKKQILIIALSILSANVYAQDSTKVNCKYSKNEVDEFTGTSKLVLESEMFISYTDSSLLKYYKKSLHQYVECQIYCAKINDLKVVYTVWRIDTESAYRYYGAIYEDAKLMFKFTDGTTLTLNYLSSDVGDTNYDSKYTYYSSYCFMDDGQFSDLAFKQVEKVRMYWSEGYEDYPVMNPSLLNSQINCLK
jgi:hypothetical protein